MQRYIAMIWDHLNPRSSATAHALRLKLAADPEWRIAYSTNSAVVARAGRTSSAREVYELYSMAGVVLGKLFHKGDAKSSVQFDYATTQRIVNSKGERLTEEYWGCYFACIYNAATGEHYVFSDPLGETPCFHLQHEGIDILFSDPADCVTSIKLSFSINHDFLRRWLLDCNHTTEDTGLSGVQELIGGQCLIIHRSKSHRSIVWDATKFASGPLLSKADAAAEALRAATMSSIAHWASCYQNVVVRLSGGLDSSIIAGCLGRDNRGAPVRYVNFCSDFEASRQAATATALETKLAAFMAAGDERHYARLVTKRLGVPLIEEHLPPFLDFEASWDAPMRTRPIAYAAIAPVNAAEVAITKQHPADAFFSGVGGDSIFLAARSPFGAIDYAFMHGFDRGIWKVMLESCRVSKRSMYTVFKKAFRQGLLRRHGETRYQLSIQGGSLLHDQLLNSMGTAQEHPWTAHSRYPSVPPGKWEHVLGTRSLGLHHAVSNSLHDVDHIHPLNSQLLWETALAIPSYVLLAGGVSRGLARMAFRDLLPEEIFRRIAKGTGSPFYKRQVAAGREFVQGLLEDGRLVGLGILDPGKLKRYFEADAPEQIVDGGNIMLYLGAEVWVRQWEGDVLNFRTRRSGLPAQA